jgi:hypothetical protein
VTASKIDSLRTLLRDPRWQLAIMFMLVLVSRLPFLDAGYGVNTDAWRMAKAAREIATTGEYSISRFPGYPVQEIVCSWFWRGGPFALNALSTLFSAIAVTAFAAIIRKFNRRDWLLSALALAATPIFFISSVTAKDYVWALAFVLLAFLSALQKQAVVAGMFLGLATGCRITSLSMLLPVALVLWSRNHRRDRTISVTKFVTGAIVTATIAFSPAWLRYGTAFWLFYEHARPDWLTILSRGTIEIWGTLGLSGIVLAVGLGCSRWSRGARRSEELARQAITYQNSWITVGVVLWIMISVALYLRLPDQAGYLLPVVPAVLLLMQQFVSRRVFQIACACLIVSPFVDVSRNGIGGGAIFADQAERVRTLQQVQQFLGYAETLPGHNTIVVGAWEPIIAVVAPHIVQRKNDYVYLLDKQAIEVVLARHEPILYAPRMREFNQRIYGIDLAKYGGIDLSDVYRRRNR